MKKLFTLVKAFIIPLTIVEGIILFEIFNSLHLVALANVVILAVILLGSFSMIKETIITLSKKQFGLDYIAILAIVVAVITGEYLVAAILALMVSGGRNLEAYGVSLAKKSLTALVARIPTDTTLYKGNKPDGKEKISKIPIGAEIFIRKGEVIGLDGILISAIGEIDESSLTGEPYFIEKVKGDIIRSGTVNTGQPIVVKVTSIEKDSTYKKIVDMVKQAENEKSPMVRLADQYSTVFTLATLAVAGFAYLISTLISQESWQCLR